MKNKKNALDLIPVISDRNKWDEADGIVTIHMEHKGFYHRFAQLFFKTPKVSHIDLDEFGSFVWKNIDGQKSVYEISALVKNKFGEKAEPLYERLLKFFMILKNNKFITLKR